MTFALIPVKDLAEAKTRLVPVLDEGARRELARALFQDVLAAALACDALEGVAAVARDEEVLALAREAGVEGLAEPGGLNVALTSAAKAVAARGVERIIVLAADLPLAQADDIATVAASEADIAIVPSGDGGTNALALAPGTLPFLFGPHSAEHHLAAAREAGHGVERFDLPGLVLDIDRPEDLELLRAAIDSGRPCGAHTLAALDVGSPAGGG